MAHLACIGSRRVNGVAELHSDLVKTTIMKDFVEFYGISRFGNVTNGSKCLFPVLFLDIRTDNYIVTPRRWLDQCNPALSALISSTLKIHKSVWLKDLYKLEGLLAHVDDPALAKTWSEIKQANKERLAHWVETTLGLKINTKAMFDVQIKACFTLWVLKS